jgi:hypothetical protein
MITATGSPSPCYRTGSPVDSEWIKGEWTDDGKPVLAGIPPEVEHVWLFLATGRRARPHCISVDGADFHLSTHRHCAGLNNMVVPEWWWMPLMAPDPPTKEVSSATDKA